MNATPDGPENLYGSGTKAMNKEVGAAYHLSQKTSKIAKITFAILPPIRKTILNGPEYFEIYYSWWNHQIRFKILYINIKHAKYGVGLS